MKSLDEHNKEVSELYHNKIEPKPNGIECPNCKSELYDLCPGWILSSYPPKLKIGCMKCDYKNYRYV